MWFNREHFCYVNQDIYSAFIDKLWCNLEVMVLNDGAKANLGLENLLNNCINIYIEDFAVDVKDS